MNRISANFRVLALAVTISMVPALLVHAASKTPKVVSPKVFEGYYKLTHASLGLCLPEMLISAFSDDNGLFGLEAGNYTFQRINGGERTNEFGQVRVTEKSYTTSDQHLISYSHTVDRTEPAVHDEIIRFHLVGDHLSIFVSMPKTLAADEPIQCSYIRVPCSQTNSGCN